MVLIKNLLLTYQFSISLYNSKISYIFVIIMNNFMLFKDIYNF